MAGDTDMSCRWEEWQGVIGTGALCCRHPLGKPFCDYAFGEKDEQEECPLYQAIYESSRTEEEVRQYLEYTERGKA